MNSNGIAITGMSCILPGAPDLETFWNNLVKGYDAIQEAPENRIDPCYYDREVKSVDRLYCFRGGFIDQFLKFDPIPFGIVPASVAGTEPDHLLTLKLTHQALENAGILGKNISLEKAGIIIGKGNYLGKGALSLIEIVRTSEQFTQLLEVLVPGIDEQELQSIKRKFQQQKGKLTPETAMGLIPNLVASIVANRFGLGGPAYTVDAACASSLLAVDQAIQELRSKRCDIMIAGGIHTCHEPSFWTIFNQLGALSREQEIRPFSKKADGILIGEGFGFVVLKRLEDAVRDGDRIYSVIRGVGVSSDGLGGSVLRPLVRGQLKAVELAWKDAGLDPTSIGYLEAHGTATPTGDKVELETMAKVFGYASAEPRAKFGSVKSMIGHAMPAAGIAGLIKTALSLYHGKLLPTLHCEDPMDEISETRFDPVQQAIPWEELPRRAGVNAFGFGGINAHVVMDGFEQPVLLPKKPIAIGFGAGKYSKDSQEVILLARESEASLTQALKDKDYTLGDGNWRIAIFEPNEAKLQKALQIIERGKPWKGAQDIWFTSEPLLSKGGNMAFIFPGVDAIASHEDFEQVTSYFGMPAPEQIQTIDLVSTVMAETNVSLVLTQIMAKLGIVPDCVAGHSAGEWNACLAAGVVDLESVNKLHQLLLGEVMDMPDVEFLSVGCSLQAIEKLLEEFPEVYVSNDNCPHQIILCGAKHTIEQCRERLNEMGFLNHVLPFRSGFHTPFANHFLHQAERAIFSLDIKEPVIPIWSATTTAPYPRDSENIKKLQLEHLLKTVRFRETIQKLYEEANVKAFIQIGAGALTGFVDDTLRTQNILCMSTSVFKRPALSQIHRVVAALFVEGRKVDVSFLPLVKKKRMGMEVNLELGLPFNLDFEPLSRQLKSQPVLAAQSLYADSVSHPVLHAFQESMTSLQQMQQEIALLFEERLTKKAIPSTRSIPELLKSHRFTEQYEVDLEKYPTLRDHAISRQREGWTIEDTMPVVPFTMTMELLAEMAIRRFPAMSVQCIKNFRVHQWIPADKPFSATVNFEWKPENETLFCELNNYFSAEICLTNKLSDPPEVFVEDIGDLQDMPVSKDIIYKEFLFHGPDYQGIESLEQIGSKGMRTVIAAKKGKGSLLDNAGQVVGLWLNIMLPTNHVAFPVKIDEVNFYSDFTVQQGEMDCSICLRQLNDEFAVSDIEVRQNGKIWATIQGWRNRRFEMDDRFWKVCMAPLSYKLAYEVAPGVFLFNNAYRRVSTWEFVLFRFFNKKEREIYEAMPLNKRKLWLISRVALKDAVRTLIERKFDHSLFPAELSIQTDALGKPYVKGAMADGIQVSIAHKNDYGVGFAAFQSPAGIDIEEIKTHTKEFCDIAFHKSEMNLFRADHRDEDITRAWVAKEAYGKSMGIGLQGNPKRFIITEMEDTKILIEKTWINTINYKNHIIGWTLPTHNH